jgi:hypothetical protein
MGQTVSQEKLYNEVAERLDHDLKKTELYKKFLEYSESNERIILKFKDKDGTARYILEIVGGDMGEFHYDLYTINKAFRPEVSLKLETKKSNMLQLTGHWRPSNFYVCIKLFTRDEGPCGINMIVTNYNTTEDAVGCELFWLLLKVDEYYIFKKDD